MPDLRLSRLDSRRLRHYLIAFLTIPAVLSVIAAAVDAIDDEAALMVQSSAVLVLVALLTDLTMRLSADQGTPFRAFRNDDDALPLALQHAVDERPRTVDMLEYSALGGMPLLAKLGESGTTTSVRLLVAHPDAAISPYQRDYRLAEGLRALAYRVPAARAREIGLEVRCYSERASLRGRLFDRRTVFAGWYTYDDRGLAPEGQEQISGGSNVLVLVDHEHPGGELLIGTFSRTFDNLWKHAETAAQAWAPHRPHLPQMPDAAWFDAVSPTA